MSIRLGYYTPLIGFASSVRTPPPALADFTLMKEFQASGQFWVPEAPEHVLWGELRYVAGDATSLTLDGDISAKRGARDLIRIPEVHGRLYNGAPCVLRDAWGNVERFIGKIQTSRTHLNYHLFLFGLDPVISEADSFARSFLKLSHLNDWFGRPLSLEYQNRNFDNCMVKFHPDTTEAQAEFEKVTFKLELFCKRNIPSVAGAANVEFTYDYEVVLVPDAPQSLAWHLRAASMVREFFMFLVGTGVYTLELRVYPGTAPIGGEVHVFPSIAVPMLVRLEPRYFYSQHYKIRTQFPTLFATWTREQERLTVVRHTLSDLLTIDGVSPEAVFTRVVQTMEHFHGLVSTDEGRYVARPIWRRFVRFLDKHFPTFWTEGEPQELEELLKQKAPLVGRISGVNSFSFRTRIRALFDAVPGRELMPLIDNPLEVGEYLDELLPRIEATRNYLTHFSAEQRSLALTGEDLEVATLQCWSVFIFVLARFLGLDDELAGDLALAARNTMFLVGTETQL